MDNTVVLLYNHHHHHHHHHHHLLTLFSHHWFYAEMSTGQIIMHEKLTLYEAMSCIELMDLKMDSGVNASKASILEEALAQGKLPKSSSLPLPVILHIMNKLFTAEVRSPPPLTSFAVCSLHCLDYVAWWIYNCALHFYVLVPTSVQHHRLPIAPSLRRRLA